MKQLKTQLQNASTTFRNTCIGAVATVAAVPAFAAIDVAPIQAEMTAAGEGASNVGTWIAVALVVLAAAGIVFGMLRKA